MRSVLGLTGLSGAVLAALVARVVRHMPRLDVTAER